MTRATGRRRMDEAGLQAYIEARRLPDAFRDTARRHFLPLADWIAGTRRRDRATLVGVSGAQGTGKSTLAEFLAIALESAGLRVAPLSLDDFYLSRDARAALAAAVHPLLATRGVPGTHDIARLLAALERIPALHSGEGLTVPRFDKARDEPGPPSAWREIRGPIDVVLLEGWCIGATAEDGEALATAVNELEAREDADGRWRRWVNEQLAGRYARLNARLDRLVYLDAPDMEAVRRWRGEQERKLALDAGAHGTRVMDAAGLRRFLMHYERITRANAARLPARADVTLVLDGAHRCVESRYRGPSAPVPGA